MGSISRKKRRTKILKKPRTSNLPYDIIENILSRLPVKSLLRFKSVSKQWYSIISDPKFARFHFHQSKNSNYRSILAFSFLMVDPGEIYTWLKLTNQSKSFHPTKSKVLNSPLPFGPNDVLCSCDGLILFKRYSQINNICIWNPFTRALTMFSCNYFISTNFSNTFGFCYDAFNDDYKFVLSIGHTRDAIRYAIYSYKNNSWIEKEDHSLLEIWPQPGLFVQGALHWVAYKRSKDKDIQFQQARYKRRDCMYWKSEITTYEYEICCFDPKEEKFKKLSKPACVDINFKFRLADLRGQLCLYRNTHDYTVVEIWVMKEYGVCNSWMKFLTIENVPVPKTCSQVTPLCLTNENYVVLDIYVPHHSTIVAYNPEEKKFGDQEEIISKLCFDESLLLPTRIK